MSTLDGYALFSSGPSRFVVGPWRRDLLRRALPGVNGELAIDLGRRGRTIEQTGRLQSDSAAMLETTCETIAGFADGATHLLVDNHGAIYRGVLLLDFERLTPVTAGRGYWLDYRIEYLQLP